MTGLTADERESIAHALKSDDGCWEGEACCWNSLDAAFPTVERIVAARVNAALTEAADEISEEMDRLDKAGRLSFGTGCYRALRIVRARIAP